MSNPFDEFRRMNAENVIAAAPLNRTRILTDLGRALETAMLTGIDCCGVSDELLTNLVALHRSVAQEVSTKVDTRELSTKSDT